MDDYPGQNQAPGTPPPPSYQPPAPAYQPPQPAQAPVAPAPDYAPAPGYAAPAAPPKKKKTWLWILIAVVVVALLGCGGLAAAGITLFNASAQPADSIGALNDAALDRDSATFEKYFDADAVSRAAYTDFLEYVKSTPDYASIIEEMGEVEAERILVEEIMPEETFIAEMSAEFSVDALEDGQVPFPEYAVSATSIEGDTAELTVVTIEDGEEVTYVLGMVNELVGEEEIWRIKEIKNIADMLEEDVGTSE